MLLESVERLCIDAVRSEYDVDVASVSLDFPENFGDVALNCFYLARELKTAPPQIAARLAEILAGQAPIGEAKAATGYVNFTLDRGALFNAAVCGPIESGNTYGDRPSNGRRMMVEYSSPNTNKPQHLGHVRTNCLGESVARILAAAGDDVVRANLINDRGVHICKSMLAYQREGNGATPTSTGKKGDHLVGEFYVLFEKRFQEEFAAYKVAHPEAEKMSKDDFFKISEWGKSAHAMLEKWESGDEEVVALWKLMNGWVTDGFDKTYATLGIRFDKVYLESQTYKFGKELIEDGLARGVFYRRDDGAVEIDLTAEKLDKKVVLRSDGTSVYMTQDIGTTVRKAEELGLDGQIWVVGNEQIYHFRVLFETLKRLGYEWADGLHHLAYGMINLPEGKMKSREGKVVDADNLIDEVTELAAVEIRNREPDTLEADVQNRARKIALAALKFMILAVTPKTTMTYDPKASVQFDGDTGPYILYAYARIRRMVEDAGLADDDATFDSAALGEDSEVKLALRLLEFPSVVARAAKQLNPAAIGNWLLQTARAYHSYHRAVPVLKAERVEQRDARLRLSLATSIGLRRGLDLLGIEVVDRM